MNIQFIVLSFFYSSVCYALPTPEVLLGIASTSGYLWVLLFAFLGPLLAYVKRPMFPTKTFRLFGFLLICFTALGIFTVYQEKQTQQVANIGLYYRSDTGLDAHEQKAKYQIHKWLAANFFKGTISASTINLKLKTTPIYLDVTVSKLGYHSGHFATQFKGVDHQFVHLWAAEVLPYLTKMLKNKENASRAVIFSEIDPFYRLWIFDDAPSLRAVLSRFSGVYLYDSKNSPKHTKMVVHDDLTGHRQVQRDRSIFNYPVRDEPWIYNQKTIYFKNIMKIISPAQCAQLVKDPTVKIVTPFNSLYRSEPLQNYYLSHYFATWGGMQRFTPLDFNDPHISDLVATYAHQIRGQTFVTLGFSKQDWLYMGLDFAHAVHQLTIKNQIPFNYLGGCPWAPQIASILNFETTRYRNFRQMRIHLLDILTQLSTRSQIPLTLLVCLLALIINLPFFPLITRRCKVTYLSINSKLTWTFSAGNNLPWQPIYASMAAQCRHNKLIVLIYLAANCLIGQFLIDGPAPGNRAPILLTGLFLFFITLSTPLLFIKSPRARCGPGLFNWLVSFSISVVGYFYLKFYYSPLGLYWFLGCTLGWPVYSLFQLVILKRALQGLFSQGIDSTTGPKLLLCKTSSIELKHAYRYRNMGNKARRLSLLNRLSHRQVPLYAILPGLVVTPSSKSFTNLTLNFGHKTPLIVRSSSTREDNLTTSQAGHFTTLQNVKFDALDLAIQTVFSSMEDSGSVIISPMANTDINGVLFTQDIHNPCLMDVEYLINLNCAALVEGRTIPKSLKIGRLSGKYYNMTAHQPALNQHLIQRLFLVGHIAENYFNHPQDIEWGFNTVKNTLYIFQSRDITVTSETTNMGCEQARLLTLTAPHRRLSWDETIFKKSPILDEIEGGSIFIATLLDYAYSLKGPLRKMLAPRGLPPLMLVFGCLYENITYRQTRKMSFDICLLDDYFTTVDNNIDRQIEIIKTLPDCNVEKIQPLLKNFFTFFEATILSTLIRFNLYITQRGILEIETSFKSERYAALSDIGKALIASGIEIQEIHQIQFSDLPPQLKPLILAFLSQWGHRGPAEYDIVSPAYQDDLQLLLSDALGYFDFNASENQGPNEAVVKNDLIYLKEKIKDSAIKYLRIARTFFHVLADKLELAPSCLFQLQYGWWNTADFAEKMALKIALAGQATANINRQNEFCKLALPDTIAPSFFEDLGRSTTKILSAATSAQMVGAKKSFHGTLLPFFAYPDALPSPIPANTVLLVTQLSPKLIRYFGKINGIISTKGGALSHTAIVAREKCLPILTGVDVSTILRKLLDNPSGLAVSVSLAGEITFTPNNGIKT